VDTSDQFFTRGRVPQGHPDVKDHAWDELCIDLRFWNVLEWKMDENGTP
jgi:hypothetical protein